MPDEPAAGAEPDTAVMVLRAFYMCVALALGVGAAAAVVPGIDVDGGFGTLLWVGLLFGVVNALLGPILYLVTLPLTIITLGLFAFVVNGFLLAITAGLSDKLDVSGFLGTMLGALIIAIVTAVLGVAVVPKHTHAA